MMPVLGVGIDMLYLPRIVSLVKRRSAGRFASRILCEAEHKHWLSLQSSAEKIRFLAVRWSVKEAAYKALQPNLALRWKETSFLKDPASASRKPALRTTKEFTPGIKLHASVSHDEDHIIAMVVAEGNAVNSKWLCQQPSSSS